MDVRKPVRLFNRNFFLLWQGQFVGQGIGGYLFVILGAPLLFLIDGISYLFSAFSESFIRIPQKIPEKKDGWLDKFRQFKSDTMEGFRFVWGHTGIKALFFAAAFINFFAIPIIVLLLFYVEDYLNATSDWYGYILATFGFGALIGYRIAGGVKISSHVRSKVVISALVLMSFCLPILSILREPVLALVLMIIIGILSGIITLSLTIITSFSKNFRSFLRSE